MAFILLLMVFICQSFKKRETEKSLHNIFTIQRFFLQSNAMTSLLAKFVSMVEILDDSKTVSKSRRLNGFYLICQIFENGVCLKTGTSQVQTSPSKHKAALLKTRSSTSCPEWLLWLWTLFTSNEEFSKHFKNVNM